MASDLLALTKIIMKKPCHRTIAIASDHAGYRLKEKIITFLESKKEELAISQIYDLGCDNDSISVDYPDYANKLANNIIESDNSEVKNSLSASQNKENFGILICGSGIGISIAANRFKKIRAALCLNVKMAKLSRQHNNANVLCLGARIISEKTAISIVKSFITNKFLGDRHESRVRKLEQ